MKKVDSDFINDGSDSDSDASVEVEDETPAKKRAPAFPESSSARRLGGFPFLSCGELMQEPSVSSAAPQAEGGQARRRGRHQAQAVTPGLNFRRPSVDFSFPLALSWLVTMKHAAEHPARSLPRSASGGSAKKADKKAVPPVWHAPPAALPPSRLHHSHRHHPLLSPHISSPPPRFLLRSVPESALKFSVMDPALAQAAAMAHGPHGGNSAAAPPNAGGKEQPRGPETCLEGLTFVISGVLDSMDRRARARAGRFRRVRQRALSPLTSCPDH